MTTLTNRTLTILLVALIVVYLGARIIRVPKRESTLDMALVNIDTSAVRQVKLYPVSGGWQEVLLSRAAGGWKVERDGLSVEADSNAVKELIGSFMGMKASRVVTEQKAKWDDYKVGDTSGTRIVVLGEGAVSLGEWWVGEAPAQGGGMYGGGQSYVRLNNDDKVYAADGSLHSQYNKPFNDWRNKAFLRIDKNSLTGVTASGAESWSLKRDSTAWLLDGAKADSAAAERYLRRFASMNLSEFADGFRPAGGADALLTLSGTAGELASIQAWKVTDSTWTVQSSQRPQVYFNVDSKKFGEELMPATSMLKEK